MKDELNQSDQAVEILPLLKEAMNYHQHGAIGKAKTIYLQILAIEPNEPYANHFLGVLEYQAGDLTKAKSRLLKALDECPNWDQAHFNLASILQEQFLNNEAITHLKKALAVNPGLYQAWYNLGTIYQNIGLYNEASQAFETALKLAPHDDDVRLNYANSLLMGQQKTKALNHYQVLLAKNSTDYKLYYNLGNYYREENNLPLALKHYQRAFNLNPNSPEVVAQLFHCLGHTCQWRKQNALQAILDEQTKKALATNLCPGETPLINIARTQNQQQNLVISKSWSDKIKQQSNPENIRFVTDTNFDNKIINIAYLSNDFHNHATAHLISGLFAHHDRNKFKVHIFDYGPPNNSEYLKRIQKSTDNYHNIFDLNNESSAKLIYENKINILLELKGHTQANRMGICSYRPANIQICYLGYPGTTGANWYDYILTDQVISPEETQKYYSEKFLYHPVCYQVTDDQQEIATKEFTRKDFGFSNDDIVISAFHQPYKIQQAEFDCWLKVLQMSASIKLWLLAYNQDMVTELQAYALGAGITDCQLRFANFLPKAEHLARHKLVDFCVDTFNYNGHTTTTDALYVGCPVLTLQGEHFASRVSSSLLTAMGFPEGIATTLSDYQQTLINWAQDPTLIQTYRSRLGHGSEQQKLFRTAEFTQSLEHILLGLDSK